ncbi:MAG: UDP-3-O-(3-hydroxymyristoyl)glucosamine N-acyltransferase [Syntrophobacteraceae bacterium]
METGTNNNLRHRESFSLGELSRLLDAEVKGDPDLHVTGIGALESATSGQLSFLVDSRYRHLLSGCRASALLVSSEFRELECNLLITSNPYLALAKAARLFLPDSAEAAGIHETAFIGEGVLFGEGVSAGALSHIGDNSQIGAGTRIGPGAYLGKQVRIGEGCLIDPMACILDGCIVGNRVIIHAGAVIGADGYGYAQDEEGRHVKIPQTGIVQIDDDVEIGANATVDRATFGRTWIKRGTKIDNLVMIAHNVVVGEDSLLVAQVGISGSTRLGNHVVLAGQVGVAGHLEIGDRVKVAATAAIHRSVKADQIIAGSFPGVPHDEWLRTYANIQRLPRLREALKRLDERMHKIEEALKKDDGHNAD